jgi:hypothetical protein
MVGPVASTTTYDAPVAVNPVNVSGDDPDVEYFASICSPSAAKSEPDVVVATMETVPWKVAVEVSVSVNVSVASVSRLVIVAVTVVEPTVPAAAESTTVTRIVLSAVEVLLT